MKTLKKLLVTLLILVALVAIGTQFLPAKYHAERSIIVQAPAEAIYPWVAELKKWPEWSPWTTAKDPTLVYVYEGPETGVGAISRWTSERFGQGQMKITSADPHTGIAFDLNFEHGKYHSSGRIVFTPAGSDTKVTWSMDGESSRNPVDRIFGVMMDKLVGRDFEEGLANLKKRVEPR